MSTQPISRRAAIQTCAAALAGSGLSSMRSAVGAEPAAQAALPFTISTQTTWLTSPIAANGYVDYAAALNQRLGRGIRPEQNAAVPLFDLWGNRDIPEAKRAEFYRLLHMPAPGERQFDVAYSFVLNLRGGDLDDEAHERLYDEAKTIRSRPWKPNEFPDFVTWLGKYDRAIDTAAAAVARPRYFVPFVGTAGTGIYDAFAIGLPHFAEAFLSRAMLRVGTGEHPRAYADILASLRLAAHTFSGPTLIDSLIGNKLLRDTTGLYGIWLRESAPSRADLAQALRDLRALPASPTLAERIDWGERCIILAEAISLASLDRNELAQRIKGFFPLSEEPLLEVLSKLERQTIDFNALLRQINRHTDRCVAAANQRDDARRIQAIQTLEASDHEAAKLLNDPDAVANRISRAANPGIALGELLGEALSQVPVSPHMVRMEMRYHQWLDHLRLAVALAAYRSEHGEYPRDLADLLPAFLPKLPRDRFAGGDVLPIYRRREQGYVLYSVGEDGQDGDGKPWNVLDQVTEGRDDAVITMDK